MADHRDLDALAALLLAADRHYWGVRDNDSASTRRAAEAVLGSGSGCRALIGWLDGAAGAYATFAILHPAPTEHGALLMKDVFVLETARGHGIGEALLRRLAAMAVERGCRRFDWTAETHNTRALRFYDRLGAPQLAEKVYDRFADDELARCAAGTFGPER